MPEVPDVPAWLAAVLYLLGGGVVGNLIKPVLDFGSSRETSRANAAAEQARNAQQAAEKLRDDMMEFAAQVRADHLVISRENEAIRRHYIQTANSLVDFRTFVMTEAGHAQYHNDRKEHDEVAKRLDNLIGGAKRLQLPLGGQSVLTETDAG